jgi:signal transduction histidine kinase/ActR/RegA family two-component response regulator/CHASE3 domain sensor protein
MHGVSKKSFVKAIKSKVIIALLLACFALSMAWWVSRTTFNEMLDTVENVTTPSERLRIVNVISRKISTLDQLQKELAFNSPERYRKGFKESRQLREALDTLSLLYAEDSVQLQRIRIIKRLLNERDRQFITYLKVRARLVNNSSFSDQVKNINSIVSKSALDADSTLLATEEKISTTTIYPTEEKSRSFFGKIFGKRKTPDEKSIKIVNEEKVRRDTIALSNEDKMAKSLESSLSFIEMEQRKKNASFLDREAKLASTNNVLIGKMFDVLRKVENEVVNQIELSGGKARLTVSKGIRIIGIIMLVFVVLMATLLYLILTDITKSGQYRNELEKARDEAEYHGRAKQRFLSNMSHEIRTPLQSIIGYTDIIQREGQPERKHIEAIYQSSEHLLQIVNEVLDYNRITSGKFTFVNKPFDIRMLMDEVVSVMRTQAEKKALDLITDFDFNGVQLIQGDPFRLKQILYNLMGNAIKFTDSGKITLSSFYKKNGDDLHFTFSVRDTGAGIPEKDREHIFNEFEQVDTVNNSLSGGTGLGLAIIKSLIEQQGGRIYMQSKLGEGSVFTVYLAFGFVKDVQVEKAPETAARSVFGKIWVVDDDPLILSLFELIFQRHTIDHKVFRSPLELINEPWDETVNFVLMDMRMPEMDGIALCRALKDRIGNTDVKVLAITAQVLPDEREFLLDNGFDGLIMKPFRENDILSAIQLDGASRRITFEDLDLTALRAMTYGDEEQLRKILLRFDLDCVNDSNEIRDAINSSNVDLICLVVHRLAGRIAQIGSKGLSNEFRLCEIELRNYGALNDAVKMQINGLLKKLDYLRYSIS